MIARSDEIKRRVVEEDPKEQGARALLNFGHTLGHALEAAFFLHASRPLCGPGRIGAVKMSVDRGYLPKDAVETLKDLMEALRMPVSVGGVDGEMVIGDTKSDKKMDGGAIRFILLRGIGQAAVDRTVTEDEMRAGLSAVLQ